MWPFRRRKGKPSDDKVRVTISAETSGGYQPPWETNATWREARRTIWKHLETQTAMQEAYARREVDGLDPAIALCHRLIAMAPGAIKAFRVDDRLLHEHSWDGKKRKGPIPPFRAPTNLGLKQLAIIREKEKNYSEAILLCQEAMKQGWAGDWDVRIARCSRKIKATH